jgi:hypothetical protein
MPLVVSLLCRFGGFCFLPHFSTFGVVVNKDVARIS